MHNSHVLMLNLMEVLRKIFIVFSMLVMYCFAWNYYMFALSLSCVTTKPGPCSLFVLTLFVHVCASNTTVQSKILYNQEISELTAITKTVWVHLRPTGLLADVE